MAGYIIIRVDTRQRITENDDVNAQIAYNQRAGVVTDAEIYTDSLKVERMENAESALKGKSL